VASPDPCWSAHSLGPDGLGPDAFLRESRADVERVTALLEIGDALGLDALMTELQRLLQRWLRCSTVRAVPPCSPRVRS
jgi:hypothetical protein